MRYNCIPLLIAFILFPLAVSTADEPEIITVQEYLVAGPVEAPFPVLNTGDRNVLGLSDLLSYDYLPV